MDHSTTLSEIKEQIKQFVHERDWDQFHNGKELSVAIAIEAAELMEIFRFKTEEQLKTLFEQRREDIEDEVADVLFFLFRFAEKHDIDLATAFKNKLKKNQDKYPVDKVKGNNNKYNEY